MKGSIQIVIAQFPIIFLCMLCMSKGESCYPVSCNASLSYSIYSPLIQFPFHIKNLQPESCGFPGFELYCGQNNYQTLLDLTIGATFVVHSIDYNARHLELSDPNKCLPRKLMSLDVAKFSPFRVENYSTYRLYNCSGNGAYEYDLYDRIDCLSNSNYTVLSAPGGDVIRDSNCTLMKVVFAPGSYYLSTRLSRIETISLTWDELSCDSCGYSPLPPNFSRLDDKEDDSSKRNALRIGLGIGLPTIVMLILCYLHCKCNNREADHTNQLQASTQNHANVVAHNEDQCGTNISGLDQMTINSYPMLVIDKSERLIKSNDDMCPICLSHYAPLDTLKILPGCLHRFHADCISQWLLSNATCPICRISPPRNSFSQS